MNASKQLSAGAAMIDITPPAGTHLAGSGAGDRRPVEAVSDPFFARAIVFEAGGRCVCLVILDLTIVTGEYTDQIRAAVCEQTGIARDGTFSYEIQAFHVGDLCMVGLPGESLVEGQLALKVNSPAPCLLPANLRPTMSVTCPRGRLIPAADTRPTRT